MGEQKGYTYEDVCIGNNMSEYVSIKEEVLRKLERNMPEIRERFDIEILGIFGSVSRGEDTCESDVDILYKFKKGKSTLHKLIDLGDYLEDLFGRKVDLVATDWIDPYLKKSILDDSIFITI